MTLHVFSQSIKKSTGTRDPVKKIQRFNFRVTAWFLPAKRWKRLRLRFMPTLNPSWSRTFNVSETTVNFIQKVDGAAPPVVGICNCTCLTTLIISHIRVDLCSENLYKTLLSLLSCLLIFWNFVFVDFICCRGCVFVPKRSASMSTRQQV